jgi:hypothetical protein
MKNLFLIFLIGSSVIFSSCTNTQKPTSEKASMSTKVSATGPDAIIYKTKSDYHRLVPVTLNEEKTEIVSFPAPKDLFFKGKPALPTILADGFLLDNRGINEHVAFLEISYEDYMKLEKTPKKDELMKMIIDDDPLTVMYNCGKRNTYDNEVRELNTLIKENDFSKFTKLK